MRKKTYRGKRAPKGFHFMLPGGKLMKDSAHGKKKTKKRSKAKKRSY
jgi:hypothetical protein